jgi:hypothetical protein
MALRCGGGPAIECRCAAGRGGVFPFIWRVIVRALTGGCAVAAVRLAGGAVGGAGRPGSVKGVVSLDGFRPVPADTGEPGAGLSRSWADRP